MGTSLMRHVDPRSIIGKCNIPGASTGCRKGSEDPLEAGKSIMDLTYSKLQLIRTVLLHLQTKDGRLYPMWAQVMLRGLPCNMCPKR
jgi:hypothetical protein